MGFRRNGALKPDDVTEGLPVRVHWICSVCGNQWMTSVRERASLKNTGCPACAKKRVWEKRYKDKLETTGGISNLKLLQDWDYEAKYPAVPADFTPSSNKKVWWICPIGHEYQSTILNRTKQNGNGNDCPICDARRHTEDIHEREVRKYQICKKNGITLIRLKELEIKPSDYETCDIVFHTMWKHDILSKTIRDVLKLLHTTILDSDIDISRDRFEITKLMDSEYANSFGKKYPELAEQWHPTKNSLATPFMFSCGTHFKVWWICPDCGNEYEAAIASRVNGTGCPKCAMDRFWHSKNKKVARINLQTKEIEKIYDSITEAAKDCGLKSSSNITSVCKGKKDSIGGYGWRYLDEHLSARDSSGAKRSR